MIAARFFIESVLELGLAAGICMTTTSKENFAEFSEGLSTVFAFIFGLLLPLTTLYILYAKARYAKDNRQGVKNSLYKTYF